jgi:Leucine-rich repeat (LRR) protein
MASSSATNLQKLSPTINHDEKQAGEVPEKPPPDIISLPDIIIDHILSHLSQRDKLSLGATCPRFSSLCRRGRPLWERVSFEFNPCSLDAVDKSESFLSWLLPRRSGISHVSITGRKTRPPTTPLEAPDNNRRPERNREPDPLVFNNIIASISLLAPTLEELKIEWPTQLILSQYMATLLRLKCGSFTAPLVVVRPGLGSLTAFHDIRLKSQRSALQFRGSNNNSTSVLLPASLRTLRAEGCNLTELPLPIISLTALEDLVLTNNNLVQADMSGLSRLTSLKQLTLMGCKMTHLPPSIAQLSDLRVLYLDMGLSNTVEPVAEQCCRILPHLGRLSILSAGTCELTEFPSVLTQSTSLRVLYLDNNAITTLPDGPYLDGLLVLGIDWKVLLSSYEMLMSKALCLTKLCLMSLGRAERDAGGVGNNGGRGAHNNNNNNNNAINTANGGDVDTDAIVTALSTHPALRLILFPMINNAKSQLSPGLLNVIINLSRSKHLDVRATTYSGINNEWLDWLQDLEQEQGGNVGGGQVEREFLM